MFGKSFQAAGQTPKALAQEIRNAYVPNYFRDLSVTVTRAVPRVRQVRGVLGEVGFADFSKNPQTITAATNTPVIIPLAWCHEFEGGRAFYTALGHKKASYTDPTYVKHLAGAIEWVIGGKR
jgi:hypothetical protein